MQPLAIETGDKTDAVVVVEDGASSSSCGRVVLAPYSGMSPEKLSIGCSKRFDQEEFQL